MPTQRDRQADAPATIWQDMRDLARFVAEALLVSGAIILVALFFR
jgi:hypothetical protein